MLVCGPPCRKEGFPVDPLVLVVGDACIQFSNAVKLLGVHLEYYLSLEKQLSSFVKAVFFPPKGFEQSLLIAHTQSC